MFVTRKRHDTDIKNIEHDYKELKQKYWDLWTKYALILDHLGVVEERIPGRIELVEKK